MKITVWERADAPDTRGRTCNCGSSCGGGGGGGGNSNCGGSNRCRAAGYVPPVNDGELSSPLSAAE